MIESVGTACHQRHHQSTAHEHCCRILVRLQPLAYILKRREVFGQRLYLLAPIPQPTVHIIILQARLRLILRDRLKRATRGLLYRFEHRLARHTAGVLLLLLRHALSGTGHCLGHILIALLDDLLHPRLCLDNLLHLSSVSVQHKQQVGGQLERFCVTVAVFATWQLVAIALINNMLYIISTPLYFILNPCW